MKKLRILFLCTGNSCRSQIAEGWARYLKGAEIEPFSAGTETHGLNPSAVAVMAESGVDIAKHQSKLLSDMGRQKFDYVITMCDHAHETCPLFTGDTIVIHRGFPDPPKLAAETVGQGENTQAALDCYRAVRDQIRHYIETLPDSLYN